MAQAKFDGQTIMTQWQHELMNRMVVLGPNGLTVLQEAQKAGNTELENMIKVAIKMRPSVQNS